MDIIFHNYNPLKNNFSGLMIKVNESKLYGAWRRGIQIVVPGVNSLGRNRGLAIRISPGLTVKSFAYTIFPALTV